MLKEGRKIVIQYQREIWAEGTNKQKNKQTNKQKVIVAAECNICIKNNNQSTCSETGKLIHLSKHLQKTILFSPRTGQSRLQWIYTSW